MRHLCWGDPFVYSQCCDKSYGPEGFILCFAQYSYSYDACCPSPYTDPPADDELLNVFGKYWEGRQNEGCRSHFWWLPQALMVALTQGPFYHPHTGQVNMLPVAGRNRSRAQNVDISSYQQHLEHHLRGSKDFTFRAFLTSAFQFYTYGILNVEFLQMHLEIIVRFGESLYVCPTATLLAGFFHAERLFLRDPPMARELASNLVVLLERMERSGRVIEPAMWGAQHALRRLEAISEKTLVARNLTVDLVVPLCSIKELSDLGQSLQFTLGAVPEIAGPRSSAEQYASMRLHLYDICGILANPSAPLPRSLSEAIFSGLPARVLQLFGVRDFASQGFPPVHVQFVGEDVPTGDVAAYLLHLATFAEDRKLADITLLLHPDFAEHVRAETLDVVLGPVISGNWPHEDVDFLYLGWRHEGPVHFNGQRVGFHIRYHCNVDRLTGRMGPCDGREQQPLTKYDQSDWNPELLRNLWRIAFGRDFDPLQDDYGGFDFSQLLVSRRAVMRRPASYWRHLSRAISARESFQLLPGTNFVSRRVDLSYVSGFNKGMCIWFEHLWHLLFDPRFFPDDDSDQPGKEYRYFTKLGDKTLPLGLRSGPDSVMMRHYFLTAEEQCSVFRDSQGCHMAAIARGEMPPRWRA